MPDLTTLRAGDTVFFRCGGSAVVSYVDESFFIEFDKKHWGDHYTQKYFRNGEFAGTETHPFDIIRIEPKPLDWSEAKPGMAFLVPSTGFIGIYIGPDITSSQHVWLQKSNGANLSTAYAKEFLTRAPEHDIEVQS